MERLGLCTRSREGWHEYDWLWRILLEYASIVDSLESQLIKKKARTIAHTLNGAPSITPDMEKLTLLRCCTKSTFNSSKPINTLSSQNLLTTSIPLRDKLRLLPLPQLPREPRVLGQLTLPAALPDGRIILATPHLALPIPSLPDRRPQLVPHAALHRHGVEEVVRALEGGCEGEVLEESVEQVRLDAAGVDGDGGDAGVAPGELGREEHVGELRVPVARVRVVRGHGRRGLGREEARVRGEALAGRGEVDDADVRRRDVGLAGCVEEERHEESCEQGVAHVVGAELDLVAVGGQARRERHDAGVVDEEVEAGPRGGGQDGVGGAFDGGEGGEVEFEEGNSLAGGGVGFDDVGHRRIEFGARARGEVDGGGVVFGELEDGLFTQADVAARHEDDFAREVGDVAGWVERDGVRQEAHLGGFGVFKMYGERQEKDDLEGGKKTWIFVYVLNGCERTPLYHMMKGVWSA